jgi:hypothetical protein
MKISTLIVLAIVLVGGSLVGNFLTKTYERKANEMKEYIGSEVHIANDTLEIVDYNAFQQNYELNNGVHVSEIEVWNKIIQRK